MTTNNFSCKIDSHKLKQINYLSYLRLNCLEFLLLISEELFACYFSHSFQLKFVVDLSSTFLMQILAPHNM